MAHILIVEDEPTTSWALAEGLADDGYTIDTFRSAEEALVWMRTGAFDLVLTDERLPGMSGLELARRMRRSRRRRPVILVSAYSAEAPARELLRAGVAEAFSKPFPIDALRRAVRRALLSDTAAPARTRRAA
ncbi:MAG TPA: response regulator [Candidatus Acidoferrales bacterium]|nr:response regulator [Candidatus Acidoferrales bacterium]